MNEKDMKEALDLLRMSLRHIKNPTLERAVEEFLLKFNDKTGEIK